MYAQECFNITNDQGLYVSRYKIVFCNIVFV